MRTELKPRTATTTMTRRTSGGRPTPPKPQKPSWLPSDAPELDEPFDADPPLIVTAVEARRAGHIVFTTANGLDGLRVDALRRAPARERCLSARAEPCAARSAQAAPDRVRRPLACAAASVAARRLGLEPDTRQRSPWPLSAASPTARRRRAHRRAARSCRAPAHSCSSAAICPPAPAHETCGRAARRPCLSRRRDLPGQRALARSRPSRRLSRSLAPEPYRFCGEVPPGQAFVATPAPLSFDSRYFGPVLLATLTVVTPLWTYSR